MVSTLDAQPFGVKQGDFSEGVTEPERTPALLRGGMRDGVHNIVQ